MPTPFPLLKGVHVFSGAEGEGVLFLVRIPSALVMGGIDHEYPSRHFLFAYHMNQVCGLGPYLHEYK